MSLLCRIGLHRWSFNTEIVDEPEHRTHTEIVRARCTREGCVRYGAWSLVHREAQQMAPATPDSPISIA
jgi:hypothetical protein